MRTLKSSEFLFDLYVQLLKYPVPFNLNYFWNFGVLAGLSFIIQVITGVFLAMHYTPHADLAFSSIEHIMRDVHNGWLLRYAHANGASMFFLVVYIHMFRGLYYGSYGSPRNEVWLIGVTILLIMILTAFMGYVLPWGQMSFWAATVITKLVTAIPIVGFSLLEWLLGGFSVGEPTLNRFFSLHYLFPFLLLILIVIHIILLHKPGSNNPLGLKVIFTKNFFHPYYTIKDVFGLFIFLQVYIFFCFFLPNILGHSDNYILANPLVTPTHIVPEWYFLPFYAILRAVPNKLGGVVLLFLAIIVLYLLPFIFGLFVRSGAFKPLTKFIFWLIVFVCLSLGWIGGKTVETPFYGIGQVLTGLFFILLLSYNPFVNVVEIFLLGLTVFHL